MVPFARQAVRTDGRLRARYHRLVPRLGGDRNPAAEKKAIAAIAHTRLVIIWNVLASDARYADLGVDLYDHRNDPDSRWSHVSAPGCSSFAEHRLATW
jgi:hypothetical protein